MRELDILFGNYLKMNNEYSLEEIELTEEFNKHIYNWYVQNRIINHELSRADFVRGHNQRVKAIFSELSELCYLIEERKSNEAICHYGWMEEEAKELVTQEIVAHLEKLKAETAIIENNDDF